MVQTKTESAGIVARSTHSTKKNVLPGAKLVITAGKEPFQDKMQKNLFSLQRRWTLTMKCG